MSVIASQALNGASPSAPAEENVALPQDSRKGGFTREHVESVELVQGGLVELGFPNGLAEVVAKDDSRIGLRMYLLDNSGSMQEADGNVMKDLGQGRVQMKPATRWEEICAFAVEHAKYNLMVGTPCVFVLLNSLGRVPGTPSQEGRDYIRIERSSGNEAGQVEALIRLLQNNGPRGVTPLADRLEELLHRVKSEAQGLSQRGQMVFLTIATDGLPTSANSGQSTPSDQQMLVNQLRTLGSVLPLQLVIRLCTDDRSTIDFYNRIDEELEFPLDILDDIASEAQEIAHENRNDWFAYTPLIHRLREAGTLCKVLDAIDERPLKPVEVRYLAELLSGSAKSLAHLNDRQFIDEVQTLVAKSPLVYDAATQRMRPIVDIAKLRVAMKVGFRGKVLPVVMPCMI